MARRSPRPQAGKAQRDGHRRADAPLQHHSTAGRCGLARRQGQPVSHHSGRPAPGDVAQVPSLVVFSCCISNTGLTKNPWLRSTLRALRHGAARGGPQEGCAMPYAVGTRVDLLESSGKDPSCSGAEGVCKGRERHPCWRAWIQPNARRARRALPSRRSCNRNL